MSFTQYVGMYIGLAEIGKPVLKSTSKGISLARCRAADSKQRRKWFEDMSLHFWHLMPNRDKHRVQLSFPLLD